MGTRYDFRFAPLPAVWPTKPAGSPVPARFKAPYDDTIRLLTRELSYLEARRPVIQVDLRDQDIRNDGLPRAGSRPTRPGVIVTFDSKYGPLSYPCDTFNDWTDNLRAIALALEHLRTVDRYGVTRRGEQYTGWKALPPPSSNGTGASRSVLGYDAAVRMLRELSGGMDVSTGDEQKAAYRQAALALHPDRGGDAEAFRRLQDVKEELGL